MAARSPRSPGGVIEELTMELTAAIRTLLAQQRLPENPYAALAAATRHLASSWKTWGGGGTRRQAPALNAIESTKQDHELCHAAGAFEFWGLANLVRMVDSRCAKGMVAMINDRINVVGGQEIEGDYSLRHVLALGGDWIFAQQTVAYPRTIVLHAEYSVSGPALETGLDMFVLRVLEDVVAIAGPESGNIVDGFHIETVRKDDLSTVSAAVSKDANEEAGFFKFGVDKRRKEAQQAIEDASEHTPIDAVRSEKWTIASMRRTRQSFIAKVKDAVVARRRIWLSFYALIGDATTATPAEAAKNVPSSSTFRPPETNMDDQIFTGTAESGASRRFCHWCRPTYSPALYQCRAQLYLCCRAGRKISRSTSKVKIVTCRTSPPIITRHSIVLFSSLATMQSSTNHCFTTPMVQCTREETQAQKLAPKLFRERSRCAFCGTLRKQLWHSTDLACYPAHCMCLLLAIGLRPRSCHCCSTFGNCCILVQRNIIFLHQRHRSLLKFSA